MRIRRIEISFPEEVELPEGFTYALDGLISMVCKKYQQTHTDRVMWTGGSGFKPLFNCMTVTDDEPLLFDESVYVIECSEREDFYGNNPHNPKAAELQEAVNKRKLRQKKTN